MSQSKDFSLPVIPPVDPWPTRKDPEERFDKGVQTVMNQMSEMVPAMNSWTGVLNGIASTITASASSAAETIEAGARDVRASVVEASASASEAKASTQECHAVVDGAVGELTIGIDQKVTAMNNMLQIAQDASESAQKSAEDAKEDMESVSGIVEATRKEAAEARAARDELMNMAIMVEPSDTNPGFAVIDREHNMLRIGVPRPEKGEQGEKGEPGRDGINGTDGRDGRDGVDGRDGRDGERGPMGPSGDITTALEAHFIQFVIEDGKLVLKYTGNDSPMEFSINSNGEMEVEVNA